MNHLHIGVERAQAGRLKDFVAGTLVMVPSETSSAPGSFWGLRFDTTTGDGDVRCILWINGMPWHGSDPAFYGMPLEDSSYGDMRGISCGAAQIEIDLGSGVGLAGREMRWDQAPGFLVVGMRGSFLLGAKSARQTMWGAHYAIDLATWSEVVDAYRDTAVEWFSRWSIVVETDRGAIAIPFDARSVAAAKAA